MITILLSLVRLSSRPCQVLIYPIEDFRKVVEINMIAPIYWVAAVANDRASRGLKRWEPEEGLQGAVVFLGSIASVGDVGQISSSSTKAGLEGAASTLVAEAIYYGVCCSVISSRIYRHAEGAGGARPRNWRKLKVELVHT